MEEHRRHAFGMFAAELTITFAVPLKLFVVGLEIGKMILSNLGMSYTKTQFGKF